MPSLPHIDVALRPARESTPYLRRFYPRLRVDRDPDPPAQPVLEGCQWWACALDGQPCGGFLLQPHGTEMEVYTLLLPPARGAIAQACAREALRLYRKSGGGCLRICAYSDNRPAQLFIAALGFRRGRSVHEGDTRHGRPVRAIYYESN